MILIKPKLFLFTAFLILSVYGQDKYSGIYEGTIDYEYSSLGFEKIKGRIAFDFSANPPIILFDGIFWDSCSLHGNILVDTYTEDFSFYPEHIIGIFKKNSFIYNTRNYETSSERTYLSKTGNKKQAQILIDKYRKENEKFEIFFDKFKSQYFNKEYGKIAFLVHFPFDYNGDSVTNMDQLVSKISVSLKYNRFDQLEELTYSRFQDHGVFAGSYDVSIGCGIHVKEINGEFKLFEYYCFN
jgi:hypothetical protein